MNHERFVRIDLFEPGDLVTQGGSSSLWFGLVIQVKRPQDDFLFKSQGLVLVFWQNLKVYQYYPHELRLVSRTT